MLATGKTGMFMSTWAHVSESTSPREAASKVDVAASSLYSSRQYLVIVEALIEKRMPYRPCSAIDLRIALIRGAWYASDMGFVTPAVMARSL